MFDKKLQSEASLQFRACRYPNVVLTLYMQTDSAYHFASAVTLILRCALETERDEIARQCVANAKSLIDFLRNAKSDYNWDLGDICINQSEAIVEKLSDRDYLTLRRRDQHPSSTDRCNTSESIQAVDADKGQEDLYSAFWPLKQAMFSPEGSDATTTMSSGNTRMYMDDLLNKQCNVWSGTNYCT
jgi:hypothetical protein